MIKFNISKKLLFGVIALTIFFLSSTAFSQVSQDALNCDKSLSLSGNSGTPFKSFESLADKARQLYVLNCEDIKSGVQLDISDIKARNKQLFDEARYAVRQAFDSLSLSDKFTIFWDTYYDIADNNGQEVIQIHEKSMQYGNGQLSLVVGDGSEVFTRFSPTEVASCNSPCRRKIQQLIEILRHPEIPIDNISLSLTEFTVRDMNAQWSRFLDEGRPQTFIDIFVNSAVYRWSHDDVVDEYFTLPPSYQLFFLHPSVIIENVPGALDGDQLSEAVALEVIGINYWDGAKMCFGYPCGASFIVSYKDRTEVDDRGWGIMFHVNNTFSLGYNKYGSEEGIFLSVDFLELLKDKKSDFKEWKSTIGR